jgi:hypothetical protein
MAAKKCRKKDCPWGHDNSKLKLDEVIVCMAVMFELARLHRFPEEWLI